MATARHGLIVLAEQASGPLWEGKPRWKVTFSEVSGGVTRQVWSPREAVNEAQAEAISGEWRQLSQELGGVEVKIEKRPLKKSSTKVTAKPKTTAPGAPPDYSPPRADEINWPWYNPGGKGWLILLAAAAAGGGWYLWKQRGRRGRRGRRPFALIRATR